MTSGAEEQRLSAEAQRDEHANWKRWGPYLSERQWGTVREDYSPDSQSWDYLPHDHARSKAYRWGEDGLLGFTDRQCRLCFSITLWNGKDPILKERLYGLNGDEGNHGEDVKEEYFYLDSTPTHSYCKGLYKYPHAEYPYARILEENRNRSRLDPEFELADAGVFEENRYFDVQVEYAKAGSDDVLIRITVTNQGPEPADLHLLPTFWFRNTWAWGCQHEGCWPKPRIWKEADDRLYAKHVTLDQFHIAADTSPADTEPIWIFTDNDTNTSRFPNEISTSEFAKDAFHRLIIAGEDSAVRSDASGTKTAAHYQLSLAAGESREFRLRFVTESEAPEKMFGSEFDLVFKQRIEEANQFYAVRAAGLGEEETGVLRQAYAGLLWTKQFYHYVIEDWLDGDANTPPPAEQRKFGRNSDWRHLFNRDIISMPDKWEYPWYAVWDSAFHMIPIADIDPEFARNQLLLFLREWYMHPNGQIPAYEWNFGDVNPPVHAWSCLRVFQMSRDTDPKAKDFLARTFQKLLLNFTWWVNRKDTTGDHIFSGGFLGLDNIGVFDRSKPLPTGGELEQADGTAWMAHFGASMLSIALELAEDDPPYADMASKFFEHYIEIAAAMNSLDGTGLWDEDDGFYYDHLRTDGGYIPLKIRSLVGLVPLFAVCVLDDKLIDKLPGFRKRTKWFLEHRADVLEHITYLDEESENGRLRLLAMPTRERLERILAYMLDENEFLSPFGIRSLSKIHDEHPFVFHAAGEDHVVRYTPGESDSWLFGGNSNWRGPIWFPMNFLIIESLEKYHQFYGDSLKVECPTGSGNMVNLKQVADEISRRLLTLFLPDKNGARPCHGDDDRFAKGDDWKDLILFYEYFHADTGEGLGASHQTGWTALAASLLRRSQSASS
jgi:hypothetical protein